jgi:hypothetical protein
MRSMMENRKITAVKLVNGESTWRVEHTSDEHGMVAHFFPVTTIDLRAAEYGFDPDDSKMLTDVILHETLVAHDGNHPKFLVNTDEESAREYFLQQLADVKTRVQYTDPDGLLDTIYQNHPRLRDPQLHAQHKQFIETYRNERSNKVTS